jgi:DNA repair protein RadA/Sms
MIPQDEAYTQGIQAADREQLVIDDTLFVEWTLNILTGHNGSGETDYTHIRKPWVLQRLSEIQMQSPEVFHGVFEPGIRQMRALFWPDIAKAIQASTATKRLPSRVATPIIITMDTITAQPVSWLWWPYLALGTLCMLDGDPGIGKSLLTLQLAASLSRGFPFPDQQGHLTLPSGRASSSLFLVLEDSLSSTIRPRLDAAQADHSRVHILTGWRGAEEEEHAFTLTDMDVLRQALATTSPRLVVIDPIQAYLGPKIDMNRANETRPLLAALAKTAEEYQCCIVCVRHPAKASGQGGGKAMTRGLGSIDFIGAARTALFVEQHPIDPTIALLAQTKNNLGPLGRTQRFGKAEGVFTWALVTRMDAELLAGNSRGPDPHAFFEAYCWLEKRLEGGVPVPSSDIEMQAEEELDLSPRTLRRAKKALKIVSVKQGEGWSWKLPDLDILSPPDPEKLGHLGLLGPLGTLGLLGHLDDGGSAPGGIPASHDYVNTQDGQVVQEGQVGLVVQEGQVVIREREEIYPPLLSLSPTLSPCPQCSTSNWIRDAGGPWVCQSCDYSSLEDI